MTRSTSAVESLSNTDPVLTAVRVAALLTVATLVFQYVTAGDLVSTPISATALSLHAAGTIALHVVSGVTALAAAALWRLRGAPVWPAVVALVVFVVSFVQAWWGSSGNLTLHVPGAIVLTIGAVVVATWAFLPAARAR